jgi:putative transposase
MEWKQLLAYITGSVEQELLVRNEYLVIENRILRQQITGRVRLSDGERKTLAELGKRLGKKALQEVASIVTPDTILAWHRKLIANKFDGSEHRQAPGRPMIDTEVEALVVRMAQENRSWGYDRIAGALKHLGYKPRHNFVYLCADVSRPYGFIVTPQICICGLSPGRGLTLLLCGVVADEAGLEETKSS